MKRIGYVVLRIARWALTCEQWSPGCMYCLQQARVWRAEASRQRRALDDAVESGHNMDLLDKMDRAYHAACDHFARWRQWADDPDRCVVAPPRQQLSLWGSP